MISSKPGAGSPSIVERAHNMLVGAATCGGFSRLGPVSIAYTKQQMLGMSVSKVCGVGFRLALTGMVSLGLSGCYCGRQCVMTQLTLAVANLQ
ncbi:hypothetical protein [Enhygromyxa salina]|uniref:hypothetical protein n=1 Tax=Enhygromyxa salina TaxID=215803 RepID=UPI0011B216BE|nr:hypothetical protein [Enhygromyxa salina]